MEKEIKYDSENIYDGKILNLRKDYVICSNGVKATREIIHHNGAACIIPVLPNGKIIVEKQYRYPFDEFLIEIPAGKRDGDEDPLLTARRELEEETGYYANKLTYLGPLYPTVAYSDEVIHMYLGEDLVKTHTHFDEDEEIEIMEMDLDELVKMVMEGKIKDSKTIAGILKFKIFKK